MPRILTIVCLVLLAWRGAHAQSLLASAGTTDLGADPQDHAWVSVPVREDSVVLLHLPPGTGRGGAATVNLATKLSKQPEAIAAHGLDAYLCFAAERQDDQSLRRRILAISAHQVEGTTHWTYGQVPNLDVLASIDGEAELRGFVATSSGLHALLERDGVTLVSLEERTWIDRELPDDLGTDARLTSMDDRLVLIDRAAPVRIWRQDDGGLWSRLPALESAARDVPKSLPIIGVQGMLAWLEQVPSGSVQVVAVGPNARYEHGTAATPDQDVAFYTNGATPSVAVLTRDRSDQTSIGTMALRRLSTGSGTVLNEATITIAGPVSGSQFVLVLMMLLGVLMMVLTFVFWPEPREQPQLPEHVIIATSSRRLVAASIDLAIGVIPAALIVGIPVRDIVLPGLSDDPVRALNGVVIAIAIASAHSFLIEAIVHRSIGKVLMGLHVHAVAEGRLAPLRPWEALVRNVVRWWLAPVALAGLCRTWRHVGDLAAKTVVTQVVPPEEEEA